MHLAKGAARPSPDLDTLVQHGWECLRHREYARARQAFEQALAARETLATAREGLAAAAGYLDDLTTTRSAYERAYKDFLDQRDVRGAARAAMHLAVYYESYRGESAIASGWFERAQSLLDTVPASPEHAWLAFWKAHVNIHVHGEVAKGERYLEDAIRLGESCPAGDEFDLLARGLAGLMSISEGRIDDGLRRLDETTTAAIAGELTSPNTVGWACCYILDACENVRDFGRAGQWMQRAFDTIGQLGVPHQVGFCRSHYIGVLTWRGEYAKAEEETAAMRRELADVAPICHAFGAIRLGEIRRRQGRVAEAAALLEPQSYHPLAMVSLGALALDTGRSQGAIELTERYLRQVSPGDRIRRLHGLDLLVRAHADLGDGDRLRTALLELEDLTASTGTPLMRAVAAEGRAFAASDPDEARRLLEDAVDEYDRSGVPYEATAARLRLGDTLRRLGREESARANFETALATAGRIGAARLAERASDALAATNARDDRRHTAGLSSRELDVLALVVQGVSNQEIGERLCISAFTVKRHIANILTKLNLPTRTAAAAFAVREGLVK